MTSPAPRVISGVRAALLDAWAVVSPVTCAGCGADDRALCPACQSELVARPRVHTIGATGGFRLAVTSALEYDGAIRRAILALKEQGRTDVARALGVPLRAAILAAVDGSLEIVTVPPSRASFRSRGFDPVALLLKGARMPGSARVLDQVRSTAAQKSLDRDGRASNLSYSLRARHPLGGRRFLLVDDVVTTGATLMEAARAICEASGEVVAAATLAHTPKRTARIEAHDQAQSPADADADGTMNDG